MWGHLGALLGRAQRGVRGGHLRLQGLVGGAALARLDPQSAHLAAERGARGLLVGQPALQVARLRRSMWSALGMAPDEPDGWYN